MSERMTDEAFEARVSALLRRGSDATALAVVLGEAKRARAEEERLKHLVMRCGHALEAVLREAVDGGENTPISIDTEQAIRALVEEARRP